jgi:hypothetical protein
MKALKSELAGKVLADPKAKEQLREYLVSRRDARTGTLVRKDRAITVNSDTGTIVLTPRIVRKAA